MVMTVFHILLYSSSAEKRVEPREIVRSISNTQMQMYLSNALMCHVWACASPKITNHNNVLHILSEYAYTHTYTQKSL